MIEKVANFNFKTNLLLKEFNKVKSLYLGEKVKRIRITYSDFDTENSPPYLVCSHNCKEAKAALDIGDRNSWSTENILKPFQNSYTEMVLKEVNTWFKAAGERITVAKYAEIVSGQAFCLHTDNHYKFRYHIPISTNEGCMFYIDKQLYFMHDVGDMYKMTTNVEHATWNAGHTNRVHLIFDTTKIVKNSL